MTNDEYLRSQVMPLLQPGEQVLHTAYMRRQPGLLMQMLVVGGLLLWAITKAYFVVLTNRRVILIRTKMSGWSGGPKQLNLGLEQWDARNLRQVTTSGWANNRSMTFLFHQGPPQTLRISPWGNKLGSQVFLDLVPQLVASGQLQQGQLPAGPPPQAIAGFQVGQRVKVMTGPGQSHPGTIMQAGNGQYLCQMPDGQSYWYPAQSVQA
jgi:hypothetical protein